jgi:protein-L-isoaspartate(D-aspartate) O-methyltransferase
MPDFAALRDAMVDRQLAGRGISNIPLLAAMRDVPREQFVSDAVRDFAYEDGPLPIEAGQTISQPYIVALMIEAAQVAPGDRVLEIGAGSGYAAAVLSRIAGEVIAIERHAELAELAAARMAAMGYRNVRIVPGDGSAGWPDGAPYDAILAAASGRHVPDPLKRQLKIGGSLVMPIGAPVDLQNLYRITRESEEGWTQENLGPVRFVPLIGAEGWRE